jgi:hypothetical protein
MQCWKYLLLLLHASNLTLHCNFCVPDKTVFGVPLLLSLQRNGQALPKCIQAALRWLRVNSLEQVGLFRKSGVRSRIQKLKLMTEMQGETVNFEGQQAYDVADMVKQYFRELPEALLTNKLSETFIAIFQRKKQKYKCSKIVHRVIYKCKFSGKITKTFH